MPRGRLSAATEMTILLDEPRWQWHGTTWSHLVSDDSLGELHEFARAVRVRYLSYQGDHYDLPVALFDAALDAGAELVDSRELVRRLRAAGLRRRAGKAATAWRVVVEGDAGAVADHLEPAGAQLLRSVADRHGPIERATLLQRVEEQVGLLALADHEWRIDRGIEVVDDDRAIVESHDPRGHTLEVIWRSGAGRELDHR